MCVSFGNPCKKQLTKQLGVELKIHSKTGERKRGKETMVSRSPIDSENIKQTRVI